MSQLNEWVYVSSDEKPYVNFEEALDIDQVVSGYVPVKSTLDVFLFLKEAVGLHSPRGRAVICHGTYGTGKSRLCTVLARLFRDGFSCLALEQVWSRLRARGQGPALDSLQQSLIPSGRQWRPWLVVPIYADGGGGRISTAFVRGLLKAVRKVGLGVEVLGDTIFQEAANRLVQLLENGKHYHPMPNSRFGTHEQMERALREDFDDQALQEFREWHQRETVVDFEDYLRSSGGAYEAHEIYPQVAERLQRHGFDGILVIWDEFGLAVESLLKGAQAGKRDLPIEAMGLQDFVERACGNNDLGKRVVFLAFTHMSLTEYGQRGNLTETDRNRLETVSARFRQPSIFIKLSVTELEGYHLLAGMLHRTKVGEEVFSNPILGLQRIATRMTRQRFWQNMQPDMCYQDVVSPCYPLHPATSATLLLLSDRIAQVNRTAFYYLQSREDGGIAGVLETRPLPTPNEAGGSELVRISDLLPFFTSPLRQKEPNLISQYEQAVARLPGATSFEASVLRAILILSAIKNPDMAPTTTFLSFCLCDSDREEIKSSILHEALSRLKDAQALWKNESTDVWNFVTDRGLGQDLENELEQEKALVPQDKAPCELMRNFPSFREEITDRLGEFDLDPCDAGIVRRISFRLFDPVKGDKSIEAQNPAIGGGDNPWLSAIVYLAAVDSAAQLDISRKCSEFLYKNAVYLVLPSAPLNLDGDKVRELIAVRKLIEIKDPQSHAYEVLENKLTRLREDLRAEFGKTFGNEGLRSGTTVLKAGTPPKPVRVGSWGQLLPSINSDLNNTYCEQPYVRCGSFNEWQPSSSGQWKKIENIVEAIIKYDEKPEFQNAYFNFPDSSQESAIIDGVLIDNGLFSLNTATNKWDLCIPSTETPCMAMNEVFKYLASRSASEKPFSKIYDKLIEPPYGVPNGIIPLFVALAFRAEPSRIAIYVKKYSSWERVESKIHEAIVSMARYPDRYQTRYSKLGPKQRLIFRIIGSDFEIKVPDNGTTEKIEEACEKVSAKLREFVHKIPEAALSLPKLADVQKDILKALRVGVPPQTTLLADLLIRWMQESAGSQQELEGNSSEFPITLSIWRGFREQLNRQIEGHRAPIRRQVEELGKNKEGVVEMLQRVASLAGQDDQVIAPIVSRLLEAKGDGDLNEKIVAAIANKDIRSLDAEDFGRASGKLEVCKALAPPVGKITVVFPDGGRRSYSDYSNEEASRIIQSTIKDWEVTLSLTSEQIAAVILGFFAPRTSNLSND